MGEGIRIGGGGKKEGLYVWKKLTAEGGTFVDYVVDNNESKYPDGGTQDGYWYEKVVEGVAGIDFGEVTLASTAASVTVSHKLGTVPSWVALIPKTLSDFTGNNTYLNFNGKVVVRTHKSVTINTCENTLTTNEITFNISSTYQWYATDYYWIAIA